MLSNLIENQPKIHTRDIQLATYAHADTKVIVHGILKDRRYFKVFDVTGALTDPGIVHHMDVKLLIGFDPLVIEDAEAEMLCIPLPECRKTLDTIEKLKGLEVKPGFSKKIRGIVGGKNGCTHLCKLVSVMGQEIVHGWLTHKRKIKSQLPTTVEGLKEKKYLFDSCRMWSRQGPKFKNLEQAIKVNQSS